MFLTVNQLELLLMATLIETSRSSQIQDLTTKELEIDLNST